MLLEVLILIAGWALGNIVFSAYERHVPPLKRLAKLAFLIGLVVLLHIIAGRALVVSAFAVLIVGMIFLHGWWFPKHGIHWRTAEPYEDYLKLIKRMR